MDYYFLFDGITGKNNLYMKEGQLSNKDIDSRDNNNTTRVIRKRTGQKFIMTANNLSGDLRDYAVLMCC